MFCVHCSTDEDWVQRHNCVTIRESTANKKYVRNMEYKNFSAVDYCSL
jgi:hypothetical protein